MNEKLTEADIAVLLDAMDNFTTKHAANQMLSVIVSSLLLAKSQMPPQEISKMMEGKMKEAESLDQANSDMITLIKGKLIRMRRELQSDPTERVARP